MNRERESDEARKIDNSLSLHFAGDRYIYREREPAYTNYSFRVFSYTYLSLSV